MKRVVDIVQGRNELTETLSLLLEAPSVTVMHSQPAELILVRQLALFEEFLQRGLTETLKKVVEKLVQRKAFLCKTLLRFVLLLAQRVFEWAHSIIKSLLREKQFISLSRSEEQVWL